MEQDNHKDPKKGKSSEESPLMKIIEEMVRYIDIQDLKEEKK